MPASWPGSLPQTFEVESFSEAVADGLIETQPDYGPPQSRLRTAAMPRPISGQMSLQSSDLATLKTFVNTTVVGGSLPFTFPAVTEGGGTWLVKFPKGGLPQWSALGAGWYLVKINLLILP